MFIPWQRVLPVIVSILVIIAVAVLRSYSPRLAAITATMPINIPLVLWIKYSAEGGVNASFVDFTHTLVLGMPPTLIFVLLAWMAARAGWGIVPMLLLGYAGWSLALLVSLAITGKLR